MKNRGKINHFIMIILSVIIALSMVSCKKDDKQAKDNEIKIWSYPIAERIMRDKEYDEAFRKEGKISITACKNEEESGQIIITPLKAVDNYTIEAVSLKSGGNTLAKECFEIFNQKYIEVKTTSAGYSTGLGWYPDALLPFSKAVEYRENKISAGENQGVTVSVKVPSSQAEGVYNGEFTLIVDGKEYKIPVSVKIVDYLLSSKNTAKSCFMLQRGYLQNYGDSTMENYKAYCDFLIEHRVMPMNLPALIGDVAAYTECAYEYAQKEEVSSFAVPFFEMYSNKYRDVDVDWNALYEMTKSFAIKSIETGVNIIAKNYYVFGMIDEARMNGLEDRAARVCNDAFNLVNKLADEILADTTINGATKQEVCDSIRLIPCIETSEYTDRMENNGEGVKNWCPLFNYFDSEEAIEFYKNTEYESWWYGCIGPNNPYPTYQIDDALLSSRLVSWMQKDYNLKGNLYWETIFWQIYGDKQKTDVYNSSAMHFTGDNGDGYLMYPGDVYGINGAVGSVRLDSIRDGMEEYELLADIENKYAEKGFDSDGILQSYYKKLYKNAMVSSTVNNFMKIRESMYETAVLTQNYDTYITNITEKDINTTFEIYAGTGVKLKSNGKALTAKDSLKTGYNRYEVTVSRENASNIFNLTAEKNGKIADLNINLGGKKIVLAAMSEKDIINSFSAENANLSVVAGSAVSPLLDGDTLKAVFEASLKTQTLKFTSAKLKELPLCDTLSFDVFNQGEAVEFMVYISVADKTVLVPLGGGELANGFSQISIENLEKLAWNTYGEIKYMSITFGGKDSPTRTLYIDNIILQSEGAK